MDSKTEEVKQAFQENWTMQEVEEKLGVSYELITKIWKIFYTPTERKERKRKMYQKAKLGPKNPRYGKPCINKKDDVDDGNGYSITWKPAWYTGRKGSKYVFDHQLVICEALGITEIPKGFVVHHIDGDKKNNSLNNLALLSVGAHTRLHREEASKTSPEKSTPSSSADTPSRLFT